METTGVRRGVSLLVEPTPRGRHRPLNRQLRLLEVLEVLEVQEVLEALYMFPRKYPERRPGGTRRRRARRMPRAEALLWKRARPASVRPD